MAFEPNFEKVASSYRLKLGTTQAVIECKLPANENSEISKVLCANAKAYIANTEVGEGEIDFNGFANFLVVYQDAENATQSLDYSAEFKEKFKNPLIKIGDVANVTASVIDVNTTSTGGANDVKVVAVVEINIDVITTSQTDVLTGATGDMVFTQTEELEFTNLAAQISDRFELVNDVEIRDSVSQVLSVCSDAFLESVILNNGFLTAKGGININVVYLTNAEVPQVRSYQTILDFSQEIANSAITLDSQIQSNIAVMYSDVKVTTNLDSDSAVINVMLPLLYSGYVFNDQSIEAVVDIFSTDNQLNLTTQSITSIDDQSSANFTEKINGNVMLSDDAPFIDEIMATCCNNVVLANSSLREGNLVVEGIAYTTVIYYNKEFDTNNSVEVELPFSLNLMAKVNGENLTPIVEISMGEVMTRSKRGREIEVNATLFVYANFYGESTDAVINSVEIGEEKPESDCVLSIYIAKPGDTLWDIAKQLNVSPELIMEQNQSLELPIVGGERIIIYRQQEVLF